MDFESQGKSQGIDWKVNLFILFKRGQDVLSHDIVCPHLSLHWRPLKEKNLLPWEANSFL